MVQSQRGHRAHRGYRHGPCRNGAGINGARCALKSSTTAAAGTSDFAQVFHRIEDVRTLAGRQVTLSFVAYAVTGTPKLGLELAQSFGTGGAPSAAVFTAMGAVTLSTTPTRYSVTVTLPSITGKVLGT